MLLLHLPDGHSADAVRDAIIQTMQTLPEHLRRPSTWDQGTELARHKDITLATELAICFCDPLKPQQRGSNENTNGLLRQSFPSPPTSASTARNGSSKSPPNATTDCARPSTTARQPRRSNSYVLEPRTPSGVMAPSEPPTAYRTRCSFGPCR